VDSQLNPYYEADGLTIYCGDCMDIMPSLSGISAVITDPPYGETSLEWDSQPGGWARSAYNIASENACLWSFGSMRMFYGTSFDPWKLSQDLVWEKHNGSGFLVDRFRRVHENIVQFYKGKWESVYKNPLYTNDATARTVRRKQKPAHCGAIAGKLYTSFDGGPRMMTSVIYVRSSHGSAIHPTQKPIGIIAPLIEYSCGPGALVLDPFMGSGSVLEACMITGTRAIGIEINERYCEAAALRLSQRRLFASSKTGEVKPGWIHN
jgi:site-specific DNA-methyltransferase (adenine-specific)